MKNTTGWSDKDQKRREQWQRLYAVAPSLKKLHADQFENHPAPDALADEFFLSLAEAFSDPIRRQVLRELFLNLLKDDLITILSTCIGEETV